LRKAKGFPLQSLTRLFAGLGFKIENVFYIWSGSFNAKINFRFNELYRLLNEVMLFFSQSQDAFIIYQ
jgi:hypothetical protein